MKTKLLIVALVLIFFNCFSQTNLYHPFPDNMIVYVLTSTDLATYPPTTYGQARMEIFGDTVITGVHYSKCYSDGGVINGIRNDTINKKVYLYSADTGSEKLLYDFNLSIGDTVFRNEGFGFYTSLVSVSPGGTATTIDTAWVSRIDSVLMPHDGLYHKRFNFYAKIRDPGGNADILINSDSQGPFQNVEVKINPLVEGVGQINNPISHYFFFEYQWNLNVWCASINGIPLVIPPSGNPPFFNPEFCNSLFNGIAKIPTDEIKITISPNPTNGIFSINNGKLRIENVMFSMF